MLTDELHAWQLFLWQSQDHLDTWRAVHDVDFDPKAEEDAIGLHCPCLDYEIDAPMQNIGTIHFVAGEWDNEVVAHELLHAVFHYIRGSFPDFPRILYCGIIEKEEDLCYQFGAWNYQVYRWLWKHDPGDKWVRNEDPS